MRALWEYRFSPLCLAFRHGGGGQVLWCGSVQWLRVLCDTGCEQHASVTRS